MESIVIKPEKEQRTMWFIGWAIPFVIGFTLLVFFLLVVDKLIFGLGIGIVAWLIIMLPILLYIPAFYKSLEYIIDGDSVKMRKGVFWRKRVTVPFTKITNIDVTQGPVQRIFKIGTVQVQTAGAGGTTGSQAEIQFLGIRDTEGLKDTIMKRVRGYSISEPEEARKEVVRESDSEIFRQMLKELNAIHKALEKKQS